jgi:hypothetical protein
MAVYPRESVFDVHMAVGSTSISACGRLLATTWRYTVAMCTWSCIPLQMGFAYLSAFAKLLEQVSTHILRPSPPHLQLTAHPFRHAHATESLAFEWPHWKL